MSRRPTSDFAAVIAPELADRQVLARLMCLSWEPFSMTAEWEQLATEWRAARFPNSAPNEELDVLRCMLAYADAMTAETILPMVDGGTWSDMPAQAREELVHVQSEGRRIVASANSNAERDFAKALAEYAELLLRLLDLASRGL